MSTLPRGVQQVTYKDSRYFRVRISRKNFKADKYFKSLEEAKEFLALSKAKKGKELIYSITEEERKSKPSYGNFTYGYFVDLYIQDYLSSDCKTELEKRNRNNKHSFLKTTKNASVLDRNLSTTEKDEVNIDTQTDPKVYRFFGGFDVRKIKAIDINNYIKSRLHFVKPVSVNRELSYISTIFRKLQYFNEDLADIQNPVPLHDRDLLKNQITKREFVLTPDDEEKFFAALSVKNNKELLLVAQASLFTGMRRSEILTLKPSQVKENYIQLIHTKSGRPRKVYLTKEAKIFFEKLNPVSSEKIFKYTIGGFDRVFREVMQKAKLERIHFHDLRRTNISRLLTKIGHDNTILATEILGIQSIKKFEELHSNAEPVEPTTQYQAVKNWHSSPQITKGYYNIVFNLSKSNTKPE
jgi:integrase